MLIFNKILIQTALDLKLKKKSSSYSLIHNSKTSYRRFVVHVRKVNTKGYTLTFFNHFSAIHFFAIYAKNAKNKYPLKLE